MKNRSDILCCLISFVCLAYGTPLWTAPPESPQQQEKPDASSFLRLRRDAQNQPVALETATQRYVPASGEGKLSVDLIAVVHVGDRAYYRKLNQQLQQYDVVLYELVAPQGTRLPQPGKRDANNPLALLQQVAQTVLDLESQIEQIDYTRKNLVHADLSAEQMAEAIRNRGDDGVTVFLGILADFLRQQNLQEKQRPESSRQEERDLDLFALLLDPDGPSKLKRLLAQQLVEFIGPANGLGTTLNTILVSDRNQAAMKVFQTELAKGKKKIAILYGAAHMPDFDKRLRQDFGLKRDRAQWSTAWDLRPKMGLQGLLKFLVR
jgi:hypothetical protein